MSLEADILSRALAALLLSGLLGWEREAAGKPAGVRTHMLVGLGACLFVVLGELFVQRFSSRPEMMRFDPLRVIEAVVTGVSFLGAGMIFVSRAEDSVKGLTTAASILATAAVGMMVGLKFHLLACGLTAMIWAVLHLPGWLEKLRQRHDRPRSPGP